MCESCNYCEDLSNNEFKKIVELEDADVAIYRYSPQTQDEAEVFIFILGNSEVGLKIEQFKEFVEPGKKTISCPRRRQMLERAKIMFENLSPAKTQQVTGVCNQCYKKDFCHCSCCDKIVNKFLKFYLEEQHKTGEQRKLNKSWVTKTEVSFKKSLLNIRDGKLELLTRLEDQVQESQAPVCRSILTTKQEAGPSKICDKTKFKSESERLQEQNQDKLVKDIEKSSRVISFLDFSKEQKLLLKDEPDKLRLEKKNIEGEQNVNVFKYIFPHVIQSKKEIIRLVSSSELIKNTQDMMKIRQKEHEDIKKKQEEENKHQNKKLSDEDKRKQREEERDIKTGEIISEESGNFARRKREDDTEGIYRDAKPHTKDGLEKYYKQPKQDTKVNQEINQESGKQLITEKKRMEAESDSKDKLKKGDKRQNLDIDQDKAKAREGKQRNLGAEAALKDKRQNLDVDQDKVKAREGKLRNLEAEAALKDKRQNLDVDQDKVKAREGKLRNLGAEAALKDKRQNLDVDQDKVKAREGKLRNLGAEAALKDKRQNLDVDQDKVKAREGKLRNLEAEAALKDKRQNLDVDQDKVKARERKLRNLGAEAALKDKRQNLDVDQDKAKTREGKQRTLGAEAALKEQVAKQSKPKSEEEKLSKQQEKDSALKEKRAKEAENAVGDTQKHLTTEKKSPKRMEAESDAKDKLKKGDKRQNLDLDQDKAKTIEGKQRNLGAEAALKDKRQNLDVDLDKTKARERKHPNLGTEAALKEQVAKQLKPKSEDGKQREKDSALREKRAKEAEKAVGDTQKHLTTERKTERQIAGMSDSNDKLQKGDMRHKADKDKGKTKVTKENLRDLGAEAAVKEQVAKQSKEKSEEEKLRKQREKDAVPGENRAKQAEKAVDDTQKQKKIKRNSSSEAGDRTRVDKGHTGKDGNRAKTAKEETLKGGKNDNMMKVLREQLSKQRQQELEKQIIDKQQQKEKELVGKRLMELEKKKGAEKRAIKAPVLKIKDDDSVDENVTEVILKPDEVTDIIIGQKLFKVKSAKKHRDLHLRQAQKPKKQITSNQEPQFYKYSELPEVSLEGLPEETGTGDMKSKASDTDVAKGVIKYTLSDRTFIDKGWTMLPTEKVVRKMNVYRMRPAKPEFDWFKHNKSKREMTYDTGEKLAEFDDNGRGRWYYRSGELALDYYDAEETNAGQRFVVYSTGLPDERGRRRPRTILATFDYSGNGIVFDHTGKIRLKYNQTEGVVLDRTIGPVSHWKWHTLNDPPVLQQVMIDTQMPYKDPNILRMADTPADAKRPEDEEMLALEYENFLKEKRQKTTQSFKPFQIRMKALKINEYFSLRVLDQASIYLLFRDGTTKLKLNIGMVLDHKEIVDTDTAEIGEVSNTLDKLPACTDSIAELQKAVAKAQAQERLRLRHEQRVRPPQATASVDALHAGVSRPLRTPAAVAQSLTSFDKMTPKRFKPSSSNNLYHSNQLL